VPSAQDFENRAIVRFLISVSLARFQDLKLSKQDALRDAFEGDRRTWGVARPKVGLPVAEIHAAGKP
jgi:hypothetical protein